MGGSNGMRDSLGITIGSLRATVGGKGRNVAMLEKQFDSMIAWLEHGIDRGSDGLWTFNRPQLADWLDPTAPPDHPGDSRTDPVLVADAYLVRVTEVVHQVCEILGKAAQAAKYSSDAARLKARFQHKYVTPYGNLMSNTQTGIALAVQFGLYTNAEQLQTATASLVKLVKTARFNISTGIAGTPVITHALTTLGLPQLAYRMLLEESCPSWLYPVRMGATTIWERWNSMLPDGSINPGEMTSFNHYALGSVANWLHSKVGGISPLQPGWKKFLVKPIPGGDITSAQVSFDGPNGLIECSWTWEPQYEGRFVLTLTVPVNTTAVVMLPSPAQAKPIILSSGRHVLNDTFQADPWPEPSKPWDQAD